MRLTTPRARRVAVLRRIEKTEPLRGTMGLAWVVASEALAGAVGFFVLIHQGRRLGPSSFASLEYAGAVMAWMLVLVRGGMDVIVYREAARHPRLVGPLTELLIGLRLVAAALGYLLMIAIATTLEPERARAVLVAGLSLFASAWVADVGLRSRFRLKELAATQVFRALGMGLAVFLSVRSHTDLLAAAACLVVGEILGAVGPLRYHWREFGPPFPTLRKRAAQTLTKRAVVAGLTRFARVTLYGLDVLALGWWAGTEFGPYTAARRLVFAVVSLGLVIPALLGPKIARAWREGTGPTKTMVGDAMAGIWAFGLPAAIGLGLSSDRLMPLLFGEAYRSGGPWLALIAARLPWLLTAGFAQAALVACRRENLALRLALGQLSAALVLFTLAHRGAGSWGVGWASNVVEMAGAVVGWTLLGKLKIAPEVSSTILSPFVGCLAMTLVYKMTRNDPLPVTIFASVMAYGIAYRVSRRGTRIAPAPERGSR